MMALFLLGSLPEAPAEFVFVFEFRLGKADSHSGIDKGFLVGLGWVPFEVQQE
jgi:hypothetical protein